MDKIEKLLVKLERIAIGIACISGAFYSVKF